MATEDLVIGQTHSHDKPQEAESVPFSAQIDTSAPIQSVKEAAIRFGGMGFWRPISQKPEPEMSGCETVDVNEMEGEAAELEKQLIIKEKETLDVLKELESTKNVVEELKLKLQNKGDVSPPAVPESVLLDLKQAKLNLVRTTTDLADIRATIDAYKTRIEKERFDLEKTHQRLASSVSRASIMENELNQTNKKLEMVKDSEEVEGSITRELQKLRSEAEEFKEVGEAARCEVERAMSEIEQTKTKIRMAKIRLVAAKRMKEAAKASESVALAEIKALSNSEIKYPCEKKCEDVITLTLEEYRSLVSKAREAEQASDATLKHEEDSFSKGDILRKVEEAREEVKVSKRALEEALSRVEAANEGKLAVEAALRKWRSEHSHKRRNTATTLKNHDESKPVLKPSLSIGQILSKKLLLSEYENGMKREKRSVSLGQMLSRQEKYCTEKLGKVKNEIPVKKKKLSFPRITLTVTKQSKKKMKKHNICSSI